MNNMSRPDNRKADQFRTVRFVPDFTENPSGSVLACCGKTMVFCAASVEDKVPPFLRGSGRGWLTAEYSLLPASTGSRNQREVNRGRATGRTHEIQRLIGRALRAVMDFSCLGERTLWVDCDVLQADGGTRTTAINGAFLAVAQATGRLLHSGVLETDPITDYLAAASVGIVDGEARLDLEYIEDAAAAVDMNLVMTGRGAFVEVQGTGESAVFTRGELDELLTLGAEGIRHVLSLQKAILGKVYGQHG
jgi:ribonuclease PH